MAFWIKTVVEIVNLSIFGRHNVAADAVYGEGFWCAVFSCGLSGIVAVLLLWHFVIQRKKDLEDSIKIRVDGRHFILSVSSFVAVIALQALLFSRIEKWSYFDGERASSLPSKCDGRRLTQIFASSQLSTSPLVGFNLFSLASEKADRCPPRLDCCPPRLGLDLPVTCLTVGYGNLTPTKPSTRIILFPFALVAIALLASQVSMIVGCTSQLYFHLAHSRD